MTKFYVYGLRISGVVIMALSLFNFFGALRWLVYPSYRGVGRFPVVVVFGAVALGIGSLICIAVVNRNRSRIWEISRWGVLIFLVTGSCFLTMMIGESDLFYYIITPLSILSTFLGLLIIGFSFARYRPLKSMNRAPLASFFLLLLIAIPAYTKYEFNGLNPAAFMVAAIGAFWLPIGWLVFKESRNAGKVVPQSALPSPDQEMVTKSPIRFWRRPAIYFFYIPPLVFFILLGVFPRGMMRALGNVQLEWEISHIKWLSNNDITAVSAAFSPDGSEIIIGYESGQVLIWGDTSYTRIEEELPPSEDTLWLVGYDEQGEPWAVHSAEKTLARWTREEVGAESSMALPPGEVTSVMASQEGDTLAVCVSSQPMMVYLWHPLRQENIEITPSDRSGVLVTAVSPDGTRLAIGLESGIVEIWNIESAVPVLDQTFQSDRVVGRLTALAFDSEGKLLAAGGANGWLQLWDTGKKKEIMLVQSTGSDLGPIAFSPKSNLVTTIVEPSEQDRSGYNVWDIRSKKRIIGIASWTSINFMVFDETSDRGLLGLIEGSATVFDSR